MESTIDFFAQKKLSKDLFRKFVEDTINYQSDLVSYNSGSNGARNSNRPRASRLIPELFSSRSSYYY